MLSVTDVAVVKVLADVAVAAVGTAPVAANKNDTKQRDDKIIR